MTDSPTCDIATPSLVKYSWTKRKQHEGGLDRIVCVGVCVCVCVCVCVSEGQGALRRCPVVLRLWDMNQCAMIVLGSCEHKQIDR